MPQLTEQIELAPLTTMKVGGTGRYFAEPKTVKELQDTLRWARTEEIPRVIVGGGSNILFAVEHYNGIIIKPNLVDITITETSLTAGASVPINLLLLSAKNAKLDGLAPFSGLPGTFGGAVRGNAGCYGREMKDVVTSVTILNDKLEIETLTPHEMSFSYRYSRIKETNEIVISATLQLTASEPESIQSEYTSILQKRLSRQPKGFSSGSFFKNPVPHEVFAGALIESSGLKGHEIGDMFVSTEHANYLMNRGNATPEEANKLIQFVTQTVKEKTDIDLEPEVRIITQSE